MECSQTTSCHHAALEQMSIDVVVTCQHVYTCWYHCMHDNECRGRWRERGEDVERGGRVREEEREGGRRKKEGRKEEVKRH